MAVKEGKRMKNSGFGWVQGQCSLQPHVDIPAGTYEEEHGRQGFFGRASHLYHRHPPTGWLRIEGPLQPRAYRATELKGEELGQAEVFLKNADVQLGIAKLDSEVNVFFRNADGDEVRFVHEGSGLLETDYGDVPYRTGDYIVIPRGTTYRFVPHAPGLHFVIESTTEINLPDRGMLGPHAQFDPLLMRVPQLPEGERRAGVNEKGEFELRIKRLGEWTRVFYPWNPMNAIGWRGNLAPWALSVSAMRPVV